jgi:hypothetical protein
MGFLGYSEEMRQGIIDGSNRGHIAEVYALLWNADYGRHGIMVPNLVIDHSYDKSACSIRF